MTLIRTGRVGLAAVTLAGASLLSLAGTAGASLSPFCKTLTSFHPKTPPAAGATLKSEQAWAKTYLPYFEKLATEAPDASTKRLMGELASYVKFEVNASSASAMAAYASTHKAQWTAGWKSFTKDVLSCVMSLY